MLRVRQRLFAKVFKSISRDVNFVPRKKREIAPKTFNYAQTTTTTPVVITATLNKVNEFKTGNTLDFKLNHNELVGLIC
jgi:hypothetical protein